MTAVIHYGIRRVRAKSEFGRIGFADHNRPSRLHLRGSDAVSARHRIPEQWTALGGRESGHRRHVLDGLGHPVHPSPRLSSGQFVIARVGLGHQYIVVGQTNDVVEAGIERMNPREISLHHLEAGDVAAMDPHRQFVGISLDHFRHHCSGFGQALTPLVGFGLAKKRAATNFVKALAEALARDMGVMV